MYFSDDWIPRGKFRTGIGVAQRGANPIESISDAPRKK